MAVRTKYDRLKAAREKKGRARIVPVRMSEPDRAELTARAERAGLTVAAYVRMQTLETPPPRARPQPSINVKLLSKLLGQVGKIGSNVNQIAARMNREDLIDPRDVDSVRFLSENIYDLRAAIMEALGRKP